MKPTILFVAALFVLSGCVSDDHDGRYPNSQPLPPAMTPTPPKPQSALPSGEATTHVAFGGNFKKPGLYVWTNGMTLKDGINAAGGFTEFAHRRLDLTHPDGSLERIRLAPGFVLTNNPALMAGDKEFSPRDYF